MRQNRKKFVQVTLTDEEHNALKVEAEAKRMSMSALLASSWLQNSSTSRLIIPLSESDTAQLELDADYKGMPTWELLIHAWKEWRDDSHERNPAMRGRHVRRESASSS